LPVLPLYGIAGENEVLKRLKKAEIEGCMMRSVRAVAVHVAGLRTPILVYD
jgi:hypothetical protein